MIFMARLGLEVRGLARLGMEVLGSAGQGRAGL